MVGGWRRWNKMGVRTTMKHFADNVKSKFVADRVGAQHAPCHPNHSLSSGAGSQEGAFVTVSGNEGRGLFLKEVQRNPEDQKQETEDANVKVVKRQLFPEYVEKTELRREVRNRLKLKNKRLRREIKPIANPFLDGEELTRKRGLCLPTSTDKKPLDKVKPLSPRKLLPLSSRKINKSSQVTNVSQNQKSFLQPRDQLVKSSVTLRNKLHTNSLKTSSSKKFRNRSLVSSPGFSQVLARSQQISPLNASPMIAASPSGIVLAARKDTLNRFSSSMFNNNSNSCSVTNVSSVPQNQTGLHQKSSFSIKSKHAESSPLAQRSIKKYEILKILDKAKNRCSQEIQEKTSSRVYENSIGNQDYDNSEFFSKAEDFGCTSAARLRFT